MMAYQNQEQLSKVTFALPAKQNPFLGKPFVNGSQQRNSTEWGFTKHGMVEIPNTVLKDKSRTRSSRQSGHLFLDPAIQNAMGKSNWHRARNNNFRWSQASALGGYPLGQNKINTYPHGVNMGSAYEVALRNKGALPNEKIRPVTGQPSHREISRVILHSPDPDHVETNSIGVNTVGIGHIIQPAVPLSITSPPMNYDFTVHKIHYYDDHRHRKPRPRPKTSSSAKLPLKSPAWGTKPNNSVQSFCPWSSSPMLSEQEMVRAYSAVTGEKISLNSKAQTPRNRNVSGSFGRSDNEVYEEETLNSRFKRARALKSAPLASLMRRQQVPESFTIAGEEINAESETGTKEHCAAVETGESLENFATSDQSVRESKTR